MVEGPSDLGYFQAFQEAAFERYLLKQTGVFAQIEAPPSYSACKVHYLVVLDLIPFLSPPGKRRNGEYPIADFYKPLEYAWSEVQYEADRALKEYIEGSHADRCDTHP
jgi:hypothetical protein